MIFSRDVLFVHVPKAAGMSVTEHLLRVLPRPVYYAHPGRRQLRLALRGVRQVPGVRHETLEEAARAVRRYGFDLAGFPMILAVLRNPYELEVSRFAYLRRGYPQDRGYNQELALQGDFERFARESVDHAGPERPLAGYYTLDGVVPPTLRMLRFERLARDLREALRSIGIEARRELPRTNASDHGPYLTYYTPAAEEAVYQRYAWVFDQGYYPRIREPEALPADGAPEPFDAAEAR